jgi:hypothetical protein
MRNAQTEEKQAIAQRIAGYRALSLQPSALSIEL